MRHHGGAQPALYGKRAWLCIGATSPTGDVAVIAWALERPVTRATIPLTISLCMFILPEERVNGPFGSVTRAIFFVEIAILYRLHGIA